MAVSDESQFKTSFETRYRTWSSLYPYVLIFFTSYATFYQKTVFIMKRKSDRSSDQSEGKIRVESLFRPGTRVDVVFNSKSMIPDVRAAVIYECNHDLLQMVISQTRPKIDPSFEFNEMDITVLVEEELNQKNRNGLGCIILRYLKDYMISEQTTENALLVEYFLPIKEMNVRSAFRFEPDNMFTVEGVIDAGEKQYVSGRDFKVKDISFTGIGLIVPNYLKQEHKNFLLEMEKGEIVGITLKLIENTSGENEIMVSSEVEVVRLAHTLNPKNRLIGMRFTKLSQKDEESLSRFIHNAQLNKIRKISRY